MNADYGPGRTIATSVNADRMINAGSTSEDDLTSTAVRQSRRGKQTRTIEGLFGNLIKLNLQVGKFIVVRLDILITLHRILSGHPFSSAIIDDCRRFAAFRLYLQKDMPFALFWAPPSVSRRHLIMATDRVRDPRWGDYLLLIASF